jgi:HD-GYP domain-containing protein (c-di-GMP phosphodiesterase class II)
MIKTKKYSFRFVLTTLFTLLMLSVGGIIGIVNYTQISKILFSASDKIYTGAADQIVFNYRKIYNPVLNSINILSHSSLADSSSMNERLKHLRVLSTAIEAEKSITAVQVGYTNGDYFIIRKSVTSKLKKYLSAPENAVLVVDNIEVRDGEKARLVRLYFDATLNLIKANEPITTQYDPRTRPWFMRAEIIPATVDPYYFYFMHKVGTTISMKMHQSDTVIAMDLSLEHISENLQEMKMTAQSELYLATSNGVVIASSNAGEKLVENVNNKMIHKKISDLKSQVLSGFSEKNIFKEQDLGFRVNGELWKGAVKNIGRLGDNDLYLLIFTPVKELLKDAINIGWISIYLLLAIIILTLPVIWFVSKRISVAMQHLAFDAKQIMNFDFAKTQSLKSKIEEVDDLSCAQNLMKTSLSQFISLINSLAIEKDFDSLLQKITIETLSASKADMVATYLVDDNDESFKVNAFELKAGILLDETCLPDFSLKKNSDIYELISSVKCKYLFQNARDNKYCSILAERLSVSDLQLVLLPLRNRQSEFMGLVVLAYIDTQPLSTEKHLQSLAFIQAFSEFAAVSLESKQLLKMQEDLLDAFIKLIAGAIDAKSPYTGGHCQRVPEITRMLAQAACESTDALFADYMLTPEQWQEIHIASWLHDCGKVTTPEYVVDKSTKLETIYDRIHEIRTRFEVLKRDAEIKYLKALVDGGDEKTLKAQYQQNIHQLDDDFEFVASCNQGGEFMQDEKIDRLNKIANIRWLRTLNNLSGVSWEEKQRMTGEAQQSLPVEEKLLSDKAEHIIKREAADLMPSDNKWGFKLDVPEYKFNRGELYNLSIKRGTLSSEERFIINDHMVQTIKMLEQLPYPAYLKNVPIIAGCHHESMDGTGYPKRLSKDEMPLTARMMAIADIFEALTASDRPYKKAKTLSESIRIMNSMRNSKHIDSDLFELFLSSGVYLKYADLFLEKEQVDSVDINQYLSV